MIDAMLAETQRADQLAQIERLADHWVKAGLDLETVLHSLHTEVIHILDHIPFAAADPRPGARGHLRALLDVLRTATTTITTVYLREQCFLESERHRPADAIADALLDGHPAEALARGIGSDLADRYVVLAIHIPDPLACPVTTSEDISPAEHTSTRLRADLTALCKGEVLARLGVGGGTVLLPAHLFTDPEVNDLITTLSSDTGTAITAVATDATRDQIPSAAEYAHQLLDTALRRVDTTTGLHRLDHLALEHQLARPGPARDTLAAILNPLDDHPDLVATLQTHLSNNGNRAASASQLDVHPNTIDNRLKRIGTLTGQDPNSSVDLWKLQCALAARGQLGA
ncbi:PucR family transcriptional regulator [Nocardia aurea]|uniref:Helix-turn-helix domain-containing protein n=1 Tax=Nocardia aurea TaxID=2144174 RepID=A0ABV3FRW8_9NOCA